MISKISFLVLALTPALSFASIDSFVNKAVLIQEIGETGAIKNQYLDSFVLDSKSGTFVSQSPDISSFSAFGVCIKQDGTSCSRELMSKAEFVRAFSISNGRKEIDSAMMPPFQDFPIATTTNVMKEENNILTLKIDQSLYGGLGKSSTTLRVSKVAKLSEIPHAFMIPTEDKSNRKFVADVEDKFKSLASGVVQLNSLPDAENLLSANSSGSGTGYFISSTGLMMTNHHVIDDFKSCMVNLACEIDFKQVMPDGVRRSFTAKATLLVVSQQHDFALLKVELPEDLKFSFFKLEKQNIGPKLATLGYPGDMRDGNDTKLTYSFGNLVGFHSRAYATSAYIYQGASGSPLLNYETLNVVAILSNGAGNPIPGIGSPGLARPINLIDAEFGLSDYISGSKMTRVRNVLSNLQASQDAKSAGIALTAYMAEKTYMGLNSLKNLMVTHPTAEVRLAIMKALEKMKILVGSSDIVNELLDNNPQIDQKIFLRLP
jgi:S1-C subfamily serine protease